MIWVDSYPASLVSLPNDQLVLKIIRIPHTPLIALLTSSSLLIYNQHALLLIGHHTRSDESLKQQGQNVNVKPKHISVNSAQLQKSAMVNLFVETDQNCMILYQLMINYSKSLYEIHNKQNEELLQTGFPLSFTSRKFSLVNMIKSATKTIIQGNQVLVNLENIEHFNNCSIEDELGNFKIEYAKLSIFKILKIGIGISRYWVKQNSHNVLVFSDKNEKNPEENTENLQEDNNYFQLINIKNFKNEVFRLSELKWYNTNSKIIHIAFNYHRNYLLVINDSKEVWYMKFDLNEDQEVKIVGLKVYDFEKSEGAKYLISFNPHFNLILIKIENRIKLFKLSQSNNKMCLDYIKEIEFEFAKGKVDIRWSPCGKFFIIFNKELGYWSVFSKFGNKSFNSYEVLNEVNQLNNSNTDIITNVLKISSVVICSNSCQLILMNKEKTRLYLVDLLSLANNNRKTRSDLMFYNNEYISIVSNYNTNATNNFIRFPILPMFKDIIRRIEHANGSAPSVKYPSGQLRISSNRYKQLSVSYGDHVTVSTPYQNGNEVNQVLWFNFCNYYVEPMNIIENFWFDDYLVLINRIARDNNLVDEILVIDTVLSKYGHGGTNFKFDSDLIIWKHCLNSRVICYDLADRQEPQLNTEGINLSKNLIIVTDDMKIIIFEMSAYESSMLIKRRLQKASNQRLNDLDDEDTKNYKIFIGLYKTVHLSSIQYKFNIGDICQVSMVDNKHFLFLLNTGDMFLLKNHTTTVLDEKSNPPSHPSNIYELIKIKTSIEYFQFQCIKYRNLSAILYLYLFDGESVLIYNLKEMIDLAFDSHNPLNGNSLDLEKLEPIVIEVRDFQPLIIENTVSEDSAGLKSIDLIGLQNLCFYRGNYMIVKNKVYHKLILNNLIEHDISTNLDMGSILRKYQPFDNFDYCLELLLSRYLTTNSIDSLSKIIELINSSQTPESIYINCLRKIEIAYWQTFFQYLGKTPTEFMNRLIEIDNVELCYNYLIVYLNFKKENEDSSEDISLDSHDTEIILKIIKMLDASQKWDWCFELCRFIKLLEPSGKLLKQIKVVLQ